MSRRLAAVAVVLAVLLVLVTVPGVASAETTVRPVVTVPAGETLEEDLTAAALRVVVRGTVDGDVTALAGQVVVRGEVTGDVTAIAARVEAGGRVGGDVTAVAGRTTVVGEAGGLTAAGGRVSVAGRVRGATEAAGGVVAVEESGTVEGRLRTTALRTWVNGSVRGGAPATLAGSDGPTLRPLAGGETAIPAQVGLRPGRRLGLSLFEVYRFLANLVLGAVLVGLFPRFSERLAGVAVRDPIRTWLVGLGVTVVGPLVLVLFGLSLFGVPIALAGTALYLVASWVGSVYGRYVVGVWLLGALPRAFAYGDISVPTVDNRWVALLVGAFAVELLVQLPYLGPVVDAVVLVLGLGGLARLGYRSYRRTERGPLAGGPAASPPTE